MGQKLLPKDCLPAAAAAQRSPRSAETLSLKHLPARPGRPNQYQKIKKRAFAAPLYPCLGKYMPFFFFVRVARSNRLISKKIVFVHRFFGPSIFFVAASGCKTLLLASVFYHGKNASTSKIFKKNVVVSICGPPAPTWSKNMTTMCRKNFARVSPFILPQIGP